MRGFRAFEYWYQLQNLPVRHKSPQDYLLVCDNGKFFQSCTDKMKKRGNHDNGGKDLRGNHGSAQTSNPHEKKKARKDAEKLVETGVNLQESGQVLEAHRAFDDALKVFPNLPGALYCKCILHIQQLDQESNIDTIWELSVALISRLLKIIKDDTSGRGETTGFSHRALADLIFSRIHLFETNPIPKDFEQCMRRTFPTRYIIPYDKIIDQKLKLLMAADIHYDFTVTILQGHNSLDEFYYEQALVKNAVFLHTLASSKTSAHTSTTIVEYSQIAQHLLDAIMSLNAVLHCLKSAIQTSFSNNIDTDVLALRCETLTEFWDYFDYLIQLINRNYQLSKESSLRQLYSETHSTMKLLATICEETSVVTESFYSLYRDDNASLLAISGDLLASYLEWDVLFSKVNGARITSDGLLDLFINTRVSQIKIICVTMEQHFSSTTSSGFLKPHDMVQDNSNIELDSLESSSSTKEVIALELANYLADFGDMLALVSSLAAKWDSPNIAYFIDLMNRELPVLVGSLSNILFKLAEEMSLTFQFAFTSFSEFRHSSELLRFALDMFEVSLVLWKKVNDEKTIEFMSASLDHLEVDSVMQIDGQEVNLKTTGSDQRESFEIDMCHNMACISWRLGDDLLCQKMVLRCFFLASGVNTTNYLDTNLLNSNWISEVVSSKCAEVIENIYSDEDFQGIQSKVWLHEMLTHIGLSL